MRRLLFLFGTILLTGCASPIILSYEEQCALKGLTFSGVTNGTGTSSAYNPTSQQWAFGITNSEFVSCETPKDQRKTCEANVYKQMAQPELQFNDSLGSSNTLTIIGFFVYIVPGVIMSARTTTKRHEAEKNSLAVYESLKNSCNEPSPTVKPASTN